MADQTQIKPILAELKEQLLAELTDQGWPGELSSSALATPVAVVALAQVDPDQHQQIIAKGIQWLVDNCNPDGGWGDTVKSKSNLSTTLLGWSAMSSNKRLDSKHQETIEHAEQWLKHRVGSLEPLDITRAVKQHYGNDRTFSAPILTMMALAGCLGEPAQAWKLVPQLPFELAVVPHRFFKWLQLPVVSYALPALIAIGLARHKNRPIICPGCRILRNLTIKKVMKVLEKIQPANGGFLEATPLTSFVTMNLVSAGFKDHVVTGKAADFLLKSVRADGSWPIDTNLATWLTTLAVNALSPGDLSEEQQKKISTWLLGQQYREIHPYTNAPPGGWSWTDLPGGVPDADDTAGAILALRNLPESEETVKSVIAGIDWLLGLQNRDGGIPTFCRGWGKLPFDRSCPDLTAHAVAALSAWVEKLDGPRQQKIMRAISRMMKYLKKIQRQDGAWIPLWFGNEAAPDSANPVYGTVRVLVGITEHVNTEKAMLEAGYTYLRSVQNEDGGWGGASEMESTVEESSLAVTALLDAGDQASSAAVDRGIKWLMEKDAESPKLPAAPIGLYFASLWYDEKLYPWIFYVGALNKYLKKNK